MKKTSVAIPAALGHWWTGLGSIDITQVLKSMLYLRAIRVVCVKVLALIV